MNVPDELMEKIITYYNEKKSVYKAAKRFGISATTIYRLFKARNIECDGLKLYRTSIRKLPDAQVIREKYESGKFASEIAKEYGVCTATVLEALGKAGVKRRRRGNTRKEVTEADRQRIFDLYAELGSATAVASMLGRHQVVVSRVLKKAGLGGKGRMETHRSWKGGKVKTSGGYIGIMVPRDDQFACMSDSVGYVLEHRLVMARSLGRPLTKEETVHHIDGNKGNNELSNLQLRSGRHGKGVVFKCRSCGSHDIIESEL